MRISVRDLVVQYHSPGGGILTALGPLNCDIESGTFVSLIGPSGCGKSTLIRVLAGLQGPTRGSVALDSQQISEPHPGVGLMFQDANLMPWRTVRDNVALPLELAGVPKQARYQAVADVLPVLGLSEFALAYPGELSGGMAQRAALGRVMIQQPAVLLLDEPFGALDAMTREQLSLDLLSVWARERQTALMVTHDIHEAVLLSDRVLVMSARPGQIVADIAVPLPRPRRVADSYTDTFIAIARQLRGAIVQK